MIIDYTLPDGTKGQYNIADWMVRQLDRIRKLINEKDRDYVLIIDGPERCGKTTLACQLAYYVDKEFTQESLCLTPDEFVNKISNAKKGSAIVFDEAFTGLASSKTMSKVNKLLVELMMEMGKKNLFVIACLPSVFYLDKYVALHRSRGLIHCYFSRGKPGNYMIYNQRKLKLLYLFGKKKMSYKYPTIYIKKRFPNRHPVDWITYEKRKIDALKVKKEISPREKRWFNQRNAALYLLSKKAKFSQQEIEDNLAALGFPVCREEISVRTKQFKVEENPKYEGT